jgi:hypothetical protein
MGNGDGLALSGLTILREPLCDFGGRDFNHDERQSPGTSGFFAS